MKTVIRFLALFLFFLAPGLSPGADSLVVNANKTAVEYRDRLNQLADEAEANGWNREAALARNCSPPQETDKIYIPVLPLEAGQWDRDGEKRKGAKKPALSAEEDRDAAATSDSRQKWKARFVKLRKEYAQTLFGYAKRAAKQDKGTLGLQLSLAALHADPDHTAIRTMLGFIRYKEEWRTPWEVQKLKDGFVDHPRFGWIPQKNVKRYEDGKRFDGEVWLSEEEDREQHRNIRDGWIIESEHYRIRTNHSIEEGVRINRQLEDLYRAWKLLFFRYMASDEELAAMFGGKNTPQPLPRHMVYLFRNKADYIRNLIKEEPALAGTIGLYEANSQKCFFFAVDADPNDSEDAEDAERTVLHEATHQLFSETRETSPVVGIRCNFWIAEGIAMYMESLRKEGDYYVLGGRDHIRFQAALIRKLEMGFYVPFDALVRFNKMTFQTYPDVVPLYSQSAGMTHFLMHGDGGKFRDATVEYLRRLYDGEDQPQTLEKLTGCSLRELDASYEKYLLESQEPLE